MGLILGVAALNAVFVAVGYALVLCVLPRGAAVSYAGVALLVGAAATGVGVFVAAILGLRVGLLSLAIVAGVLAAGVKVGHSGGELVYVHGAAGAYTGPASAGEVPPAE